MVYPSYIDSNFTLADGRRLPKEKCVENPTSKELADAATRLGFKTRHDENKRPPRDFWRSGRISVEFYVEGSQEKLPINPHITKRKNLLIALCEQVRVERKLKEEAAAARKKPQNKKK